MTKDLIQPHLLKLKEAERVVNCCRATLRRHIANGRLKAVMVGNAWRVSRFDLDQWLIESRDRPVPSSNLDHWRLESRDKKEIAPAQEKPTP
jgi:excisionase family DNA binding protein